MADFQKFPDRTPFGKNVYLRSTHPKPRMESYTFAKDGIPVEVVDGSDQKVLQPGTAIARITSGPDAGKVGVFDSGAADGREDVANLVGVNDTFLPWQLLERDVDIAVTYDAVCVLNWCYMYAAGVRATLDQATADEMRNKSHMDLMFV